MTYQNIINVLNMARQGIAQGGDPLLEIDTLMLGVQELAFGELFAAEPSEEVVESTLSPLYDWECFGDRIRFVWQRSGRIVGSPKRPIKGFVCYYHRNSLDEYIYPEAEGSIAVLRREDDWRKTLEERPSRRSKA